MGKILVDKLEPGMVLDSDVTDPNGLLLLASGMKLTGKHIGVLLSREVRMVSVAGSARSVPVVDDFESLKPDEQEAARREVDHLFRHSNPSHPAVKELHRLCLARRGTKRPS